MIFVILNTCFLLIIVIIKIQNDNKDNKVSFINFIISEGKINKHVVANINDTCFCYLVL